MRSKPQTIQIFLPDGSPRSIKIAEITNRTISAVFIPRNKLNRANKRDEIQNCTSSKKLDINVWSNLQKNC